MLLLFAITAYSQDFTHVGETWEATDGKHINAHGGSIIKSGKTYYWYGEHRIENEKGMSQDGVSLYTSTDLKVWKNCGLVLRSVADTLSDISQGCIMERPKVVYNPQTKRYVMLFHLELRGMGYRAARTGFAVSRKAEGPFEFVRSLRPNAGKWAENMSEQTREEAKTLRTQDYDKWWTPEWRTAVDKGMFVWRDFSGGQMSRDMTVYQENGKAYHIYSSEENLTLHLAELTPDYLGYTGRYTRIAPGGQNEAPCIFFSAGRYWLITSGCTGWAPNKARMYSSESLWGEWREEGCPMQGEGSENTFGAQGTYIMKNPKKKGSFIFMADIWKPLELSDSRHLWLPIVMENGKPVIRNR